MRAFSIGVSVSDTKAEIRTAPASTTPNSLKSLPTNPCKKTTGKKTAASVMEVETMAKNISDEPVVVKRNKQFIIFRKGFFNLVEAFVKFVCDFNVVRSGLWY